jgi:cytochrome c-type biogenesis protein CcmH/NrfG
VHYDVSVDYRLFASDAATWLAVGEALAKRSRFDKAAEAFREVIHRSTNQTNLEELHANALRHLTNVLGQPQATPSEVKNPK